MGIRWGDQEEVAVVGGGVIGRVNEGHRRFDRGSAKNRRILAIHHADQRRKKR